MIRAGDAVASIAKPVARIIDAVAGTHFETCAPCAARRRLLNGQEPTTLSEAAELDTVYEIP